jgi:hypothetical protein
MKITVLRNIGLTDLKKLGFIGAVTNKPTRTDLTEGNEVDVDKSVAEWLIARDLATTEVNVQGVSPSPTVAGVPQIEDKSPVGGMAAAEAIDGISRMTSKEKLQSIVDHDKRTTVIDAAKKRLGEV